MAGTANNKEGPEEAKAVRQAPETEELNEEDQKLKDELDMLVERLQEKNPELYGAALDNLRDAIRSSTSSMTAVPKPLKFLKEHYRTLCSVYDQWSPGTNKDQLADILSVVAMTVGPADSNSESLKYRLLSPSAEDIGHWGHEYVRHLALQIGNEFHVRVEEDKSTAALLDLALDIVPFFLKHNAEADAVDILMELESIERITKYVDANTYARVCRYLVSCVPFLPPGDDMVCLHTAYDIYLSNNELPQALILAIRLDEEELVRAVFNATNDLLLKKQLAFMVARQRQWFDVDDDEVAEILSNVKLSEYYHYLAKELNLESPKTPEDIYKSHLETTLLGTTVEPAKQNLASVFVNAFVNAGYGNDKLIQTPNDESSWIYKTLGVGMQCATASIGLLNLWDFNDGLPVLDKYMYSSEEQIKAGSILGIGIVNSGVRDESDPAIALLADYLENPSVYLRTSAIIGLGLSYAGSRREDLSELLVPLIVDGDLPMEVSSLAALSLGLIFVGTANGDITTAIMQAFLDREPAHLSDKWTRFLALGLGLLYVGKIEDTEEIIETVKAVDHPVATIVEIIVTICSYCGSGNVIQIQKLLRSCSTRPYEDEVDSEDDSDEEEDDVQIEGAQEPQLNGQSESTPSNRNEIQQGQPSEPSRPHQSQPSESSSTHQNESSEPSGTHQNQPSEPSGAQQSQPSEPTDQSQPSEAVPHPVSGDQDTDMADPSTPTNHAAEDKEARREARRESMKVKAYCVLGIAVIAMGEDIGQEMVLRHFDHLMHYGDAHIRRAVPLAMGIISASNPQMKVYDTLSRYSHDSDLEVAINAVFAMGLVGAGTNNARLAQLLRQLAAYYSRDPDTMFMVRIAQGLVHLGKGTLTLNPFNTEGQILSPVSLGGLLIVSLALLNPKSFILSQNPQMLYFLTLSIQPRMLVTVDENLEPIRVSVRVGQAVDVVGQAGRPKTITGWVTHTTPVLLSVGERAELEEDEYISLSASLEGVVILRKNPDYAGQNEL